MTLTQMGLTFDCGDPALLAEFWAAALAYEKQSVDANFAALHGPNGESIYFQRVPEPKVAKNRLHLDLAASDMAAEVDRLIELGGRKQKEFNLDGARWTVMVDPEGNEFCVAPHE